jgi:small glutamine-rich tetratricopeptide repeat-containing protein alpha
MENKVNYNIVKYLKDLANKRNDATLQTGVEYLTTAFNLSLNEENDKQYLVHDFHNLLEHAVGGGSSQKSTSSTSSSTSDIDKKFEDYKKILISKNYFAGTTEGSQEYNDRLLKAKDKFYEKYKTDNANTNTNTTTIGSDEDNKKKSEELKVQGNEKFKLKDFDGAIKCYSEAIQLYPNSIYYHNRGIAYSKVNQHQDAINDYKKCILLDPKYIKAYDRLGLAYLQLNQVSDAIDTFNKGLEVDPTNQELQTHLSEATQQAEDDMGGVGGGQQNVGGGGGGMPNLGNLNLGNVQEMMQNPNFMENLGPLLQNPAVMNMTMQLMNDPNFQNMMGNMMNNPNLANLFGGMGGNPPPPGNQQQ